jgi:hypothetical protein
METIPTKVPHEHGILSLYPDFMLQDQKVYDEMEIWMFLCVDLQNKGMLCVRGVGWGSYPCKSAFFAKKL